MHQALLTETALIQIGSGEEDRRFKRHSCAPWAGQTRPNPALDALIAIFSVDSGPLRAGESGRDSPSERAYTGLP